MSINRSLTEKEQGLIAVGASIAAGCRPCTLYHFRAARAAGADEHEIRQAVNDALCVRRSATESMAQLAAKHLKDAPGPETARDSEKSRLGELVSISAALAVNCAASLETHLAAAYQLGATVRQIQTALSIARAIKNMAGKKAEEAIAKVAKESQVCAVGCSSQNDAARATEEDERCSDDCGCHADANRPSPASASCCGEAERAAA